MLLVAVVGKPNSGKSSFFKAATTIDVKISPVPFTTIRPNLGVAHVRVKCPDADLGTKCSPRYGHCENGVRWLPFQLMDVAGRIEKFNKKYAPKKGKAEAAPAAAAPAAKG